MLELSTPKQLSNESETGELANQRTASYPTNPNRY